MKNSDNTRDLSLMPRERKRPAARGRPPRSKTLGAVSTEQRLFDAALTLFAERGYAATSTREIIEAAGVTKPVLYHYCRDKADLFRRLVERHFRDSHRQLTEVLAQTTGCEARLRTFARRSFAYCVADPRIPRLMFQTYFGPSIPEVSRVLKRLTSTRFQLVRQLMRDGLAAGELAPAHEELLALAFCCLLDQPLNLFARLPRPQRYLTPALADSLVTLFLAGTASQSRRHR